MQQPKLTGKHTSCGHMMITRIDSTLSVEVNKLSHDAQFFLMRNLDILHLPTLYPRYKQEFDDDFQNLYHRGLIIEEWQQLLGKIEGREQYRYISLALQHEINQYNAVILNRYNFHEIKHQLHCLMKLKHKPTFQKNLLVFYLNLVDYICVTFLNRTKEAIGYFTRAITLDESVVDNYLSRGACYYSQKEYGRALVDYSRAIDLAPTAQNYECRGIVHQNMKKYDLAINDFSSAIQLSPTNSNLYMWRALCYESCNQTEKQCLDYEQVIRIDPENADAHFSMGNVLVIRLSQYERAIGCLEKAITIEPAYSRAYNVLGYCYECLGKFDVGLECYKKAIEVNPNSAAPYFNIGHRHLSKGKCIEALQNINSACMIDSSDPRYLEEHSHLINLLKKRSSAYNSDLFNENSSASSGA